VNFSGKTIVLRLRWILPCLLVALLFAAYAGWRVWQVRSDLQAASTSAHRLRSALADGDQRAAERELATLQGRSAAAADRTDGPLWSVLAAAPLLGDDAAAVRTTSQALDALSRDGLTPLVASSADLDAGAFAPKAGTVPLDAVSGLAEPVGAGSDAFAAARNRLDEVDPDGLVGPVRRPFEDLSRVVHDGARALETADKAVRLLPSMLGGQDDRRYLLVVQNNAEVRATGGMPGAVALVDARDGRIRMSRQATAGAFPELKTPVLPLTAEERAVFGGQLGVFFQDANFTPDFSRTAELLAARWQQQYDGRLDGVLSVDPVALSYLLEATGPVTVDGVTLSSANAADQLLNRTYLRLPDPKRQDAFFREVARAVFDAVSSGTGSPQRLIEALARGAGEGRLLVHSFDPAEQRELDGTRVAGELPGDADGRPQVGVYLNDATGSKMSYYLDYTADVASTTCSDGRQRLTGQFAIGSRAPADAASLPASITGGAGYGIPAGSQMVATDIYGPVGGTLDDFVLDGKPLSPPVLHYQGRPVASLALFFDPGQELDLTWKMTTGPAQTGDIDIRVTPGVRSGSPSSVAATGCHD